MIGRRRPPAKLARWRCKTCGGWRRLINLDTGKAIPCPGCNGTDPTTARAWFPPAWKRAA